ncbi:c-type cytochrome [Orrella sp. JC864]|uniref:c-type cytochrome n=1 Tax=Orrella sp. JC864 TaxID=3120298 RepID=UPI0012BD21B4
MQAKPSTSWCPAIALLLLVATPPAGTAQQLDGARLFQQRCAACHAIEPGQNRIGPHLAGLAGRKAASVDGARYSQALRDTQAVWDAQTLDRFLANPRQFAPGTTMNLAMPNAGERKALVDYLIALP